jgi:hypothetical protein
MMNVSGPEFFVLALLWLVPVIIAYWVIRLAVRHGVTDAHRKLAEDPGQARP